MNIGPSTQVQPRQAETLFPTQTQPRQAETPQAKDIASPTPQQPNEGSAQSGADKSFLGRLKGYANTMMGNHPIGLLLGLFGVKPPFQQEGKAFRHDIGRPIADAVATGATMTGFPWVAAGANLTKAGMDMQDDQYANATKDVLAAIPKGTAAKGVQKARETYNGLGGLASSI